MIFRIEFDKPNGSNLTLWIDTQKNKVIKEQPIDFDSRTTLVGKRCDQKHFEVGGYATLYGDDRILFKIKSIEIDLSTQIEQTDQQRFEVGEWLNTKGNLLLKFLLDTSEITRMKIFYVLNFKHS